MPLCTHLACMPCPYSRVEGERPPRWLPLTAAAQAADSPAADAPSLSVPTFASADRLCDVGVVRRDMVSWSIQAIVHFNGHMRQCWRECHQTCQVGRVRAGRQACGSHAPLLPAPISHAMNQVTTCDTHLLANLVTQKLQEGQVGHGVTQGPGLKHGRNAKVLGFKVSKDLGACWSHGRKVSGGEQLQH